MRKDLYYLNTKSNLLQIHTCVNVSANANRLIMPINGTQ